MIITIYAGGIPFNGETVLTKALGGSESAAYYVARELAARGHEVTVFTDEKEEGVWDGVRYTWLGERGPDAPLGSRWHYFIENTPTDVCIAQRHPLAFHRRTQAKVCLFWAHDICVRRNDGPFMAGLWQTSRVLTVSEWFREQMLKTWTVNPSVVTPIHNGVDYSLFADLDLKDNSLREESKPVTMIYCSRPERGLDNLVGPGMIMEQLLERAPHVRLKVCGYEHAVPQLQGFYDGLRQRIDQLPNCEHVGALSKPDLYRMMCEEADVWCYPTEFEEVSCITAMECMAAGMTLLTTRTGALPETIGSYPNATLLSAEGGVPIDRFVNSIARFDNVFRRRPDRRYSWSLVADEIEEIIDEEFRACAANREALARHLLRVSDVTALRELMESGEETISEAIEDQLRLYDFARSPREFAEHYARGTATQYDREDWHYEEGFENHPRYRAVAANLYQLSEGSSVVDYGCAHGHFTNYLARQFPKLKFVGLDVSPSAIREARRKAEEWQLENVEFYESDWLDETRESGVADVDCLILGEILEHVPDPSVFLDTAREMCGACEVIVTTPAGPWEEMSYERDHPWRYHLHHLEKEDLTDLLPEPSIIFISAGFSESRDVIGWYVSTFRMEADTEFGQIDYDRKLATQAPRQTVSLTVIAKNAEGTIRRMLTSAEPVVDEIIVGIDRTTDDRTREVITDFQRDCLERHRTPELTFRIVEIDSPLKIGFDAARNELLPLATCDWILWMDADEELVGAERMLPLLRRSAWEGYGVPQHHFSVDPAMVLNTDFPCRLFRRNPDVRFLGVVHEHPEHVEKQNHGLGHAWVASDMGFSIAHGGYQTEEIRRARFARNLDLMARDRKENPDRLLGKFLWIRDLSLMCRFDLERTGGLVTEQMVERAQLGLRLWEETLEKNADHPQVRRMVGDHLQFYDTLTNVLNVGFVFRIKVASGLNGSAPQLSQVPELSARFMSKKHLDLFLSVIIDREVEHYEDRYL